MVLSHAGRALTDGLARDAAIAASDRLKLFAQPQRLMILSALVGEELSVGAIDTVTGIGQPALSQQLAELRRGDLVAQRRVAKQVLYRLADERITAIVRYVAAVFGDDGDPLALPTPRDRPAKAGATPSVQSAAMFAVVTPAGSATQI